MQTCKLWVEPNFLFQLCPSFSFMMVWYTCQKTVTAVTNTNQREINERRTGSTDFKLFKFRQEWNVSLIFTFVTTRCEAKGWGVFPSRMWCLWRADMWGRQPSQPSQPSWTPAELLGTCFLQRQVSLFTAQQTTIPRLPETCHGRIHTPNHNSCVLDYSCPAQCPVGASRPRPQTQMGVQARDGFHMSLCTCKCVISLLFFFLSLIFLSFFLFFSWKCPTGTERRWYKGSSVIPINTFQHRAGIQSQLEVYLSLNGYWKVEYY